MQRSIAWGAFALVVSAFWVGSTIGADTPGLKSGLQVGEFASPFDVEDVTGPNQGLTLCYRWQYGQSPVVCVFARQTSDSLTSLVKSLDSEIAKDKSLKSFVVLLDDEDETAKRLKALAKQAGIANVPLTMSVNPGGPLSYKIHKDADITVVMWRGSQVKVNHAFKKGDMTQADVKTVVADLPKILQNK